MAEVLKKYRILAIIIFMVALAFLAFFLFSNFNSNKVPTKGVFVLGHYRLFSA